MQPGTDRLSDQAIGSATGAVLGGVAPVALPAVAKAAGWIWDAVGGRLIQVKAGKILREISGDNLAAIQAANANAAPGLTSAQAVQEAGTIAPAYQAMNQRAPTANIAAAKANKEAADTAARAAQIESVTPDIEAPVSPVKRLRVRYMNKHEKLRLKLALNFKMYLAGYPKVR
jgi:hypothetical protein